ncbi:NAD(+) diphosphatase [Actinospica sp. MGRD01-02]|uniref:NAD(+) diphosphatase n=1 Tax=Actinospica acidithermotolerans TaxID=2828514 RepID=A0A941EEM2_9ACTN|nr:NAD(+) diphosphatase [Actinospica acidithermotolerans]MBR7830071.1 NAD(+) diphosphatase [Actinospica acidithermotolerans]
MADPRDELTGPLGRLALGRSAVDRQSELRLDEPALAAAWSNPDSRVLVVSEGRALVLDEVDPVATDSPDAALARLVLLPSLDAPEGERFFLGRDEQGRAYFAVPAETLPGRQDAEARSASLREVGMLLSDLDAGLLTHAVALEYWHRSHRFCPRCGHPMQSASAGHVRRCAQCGTEHYPRTDPAVIMAVTDPEDRLLLGRQAAWDANRYSVLAGFVEPGESLESAVAREVAEEAGLTVTGVEYLGSQPWPFPCSLMLGFRARVDDPERIRADGDELQEVRWFSRAELSAAIEAGEVIPAGRISIARKLIENWFGEDWNHPAGW